MADETAVQPDANDELYALIAEVQKDGICVPCTAIEQLRPLLLELIERRRGVPNPDSV